MKHNERLQLAEDLTKLLVRKYPNEIILGGIYGSVSRKTDLEWSDLDMMFVSIDGSKAKSKAFIYKDTAIGYEIIEKSKLEKELASPSIDWPLHMGILDVLKVIYGDSRLVNKWMNFGRSIQKGKFKECLEKNLSKLVIESYGRIHSCKERNNIEDIYCAVYEVLLEMNRALCLLNERWVRYDYYKGLEDAFSFPKLPHHYKELVPILWNSRGLSLSEITSLSDKLINSFWDLLESEGVVVRSYLRVEDLESEL